MRLYWLIMIFIKITTAVLYNMQFTFTESQTSMLSF